MSTQPGAGDRDPHQLDSDGMLHREYTPDETTEPVPKPEFYKDPDFYKDFVPPVASLGSTSFYLSEIKTHDRGEAGNKAKPDQPPINHERSAELAKESFGGFGPGSPEYDTGRRLQIVVPDARAAVRWFDDAEIGHDCDRAQIEFETRIADYSHSGVGGLSVEFTRTRDTSLMTARIDRQPGALRATNATDLDENGHRIDTYGPAKQLFREHMMDRLNDSYPDRVRIDDEEEEIAVVELDRGDRLYVDMRNMPFLSVTVNGTSWFTAVRRGDKKPTQRQLERELLVLRDHFPGVAEAYADFHRQQLPKTKIEVVYGSESTEESDPVNPQRLEQLRQELIVEPREDDFKYIGGMDATIAKLKEAALGFSNPEAFREFGVNPPRGILLQGPPGVGKTSLAMAFAHEAEAVLLNLKASTIKSAYHGETERNIRGAFQLADELVDDGEIVVIFIDEIESLAPARDSMSSSNIDRNVTTELLQAMNVDRENCIIIAATNVPGNVDPALVKNSSRFTEQIEIDLPDMEARIDIINKLFHKFADKSSGGTRETLFDPAIQIDTLAQGSEGLTGADIENAIKKVLLAKAVTLAKTGERPDPATNGEIYQSLKNVEVGKGKTGNNYL